MSRLCCSACHPPSAIVMIKWLPAAVSCVLQGATVRVQVINSVTLENEAFQGADGLLPFTTNADTYPFVVPTGGVNQWSAIIRNANNNAGTAGSPIPHAGSWRFRITVVGFTSWHRAQ